jgi:hypothetical protein
LPHGQHWEDMIGQVRGDSSHAPGVA